MTTPSTATSSGAASPMLQQQVAHEGGVPFSSHPSICRSFDSHTSSQGPPLCTATAAVTAAAFLKEDDRSCGQGSPFRNSMARIQMNKQHPFAQHESAEIQHDQRSSPPGPGPRRDVEQQGIARSARRSDRSAHVLFDAVFHSSTLYVLATGLLCVGSWLTFDPKETGNPAQYFFVSGSSLFVVKSGFEWCRRFRGILRTENENPRPTTRFSTTSAPATSSSTSGTDENINYAPRGPDQPMLVSVKSAHSHPGGAPEQDWTDVEAQTVSRTTIATDGSSSEVSLESLPTPNRTSLV
ncbi:unnamed protein product [Amoebophrya sp. A120]|nr:unnamed protein product [Amoebophrya sp. A120]|eukprot:GSA120T00025923001.1